MSDAKPFSDEELKSRRGHLDQKKAYLRQMSGSGNALNFIETLEDRYFATIAARNKRIEQLRERIKWMSNKIIQLRQALGGGK